jgi:hypothetical protein
MATYEDWPDLPCLLRARPGALARLAQSLGIHEPWGMSHERLARLTYRVMRAHRGTR